MEKQTRTIEKHWNKTSWNIKTLESVDKKLTYIYKKFISKRILNPEIINELENIWEQVQKINRRYMLYKGYKNTNDFTVFKAIQSLGDAIWIGIVTMDLVNVG